MGGMVWLSVGIRSQSWWTKDDAEVLKHSADCTGNKISNLLQGALFIAGLGTPAVQTSETLDCFDGYTSDSLLNHISNSLQNGYDDGMGHNVSAIERPHIELIGASADAICIQAKATQRMLVDHDITQLRSPQQDVYQEAV